MNFQPISTEIELQDEITDQIRIAHQLIRQARSRFLNFAFYSDSLTIGSITQNMCALDWGMGLTSVHWNWNLRNRPTVVYYQEHWLFYLVLKMHKMTCPPPLALHQWLVRCITAQHMGFHTGGVKGLPCVVEIRTWRSVEILCPWPSLLWWQGLHPRSALSSQCLC